MRHALSYRSDGGIADLFSALMSREVAITGARTLTKSAYGKMHICSGTATDYTIDLPTAVGAGRKLIGFRMAPIASLSKLVTLNGIANEAIDGSLTRVMWADEVAILLSDGSNWFKVAGKSCPMIAQMHLSADQTGVVTSTTTKINVDTSDINNTGAMVDTTNKEINIVRPAFYSAGGEVRVVSMPGNGISSPAVAKNGTNFTLISILPLFINDQAALTAVGIVSAVVSDAITLTWFHSAGVNASAYGDVLANGPCVLSVTEIPQW